MFFKKQKIKEDWSEYFVGQAKGWQCASINELGGIKHLFTSRYNDFNLGKHAPTVFPEKSVDKNRQALCKSLDLNTDNLIVLPLGHTNNVLVLDSLNQDFVEQEFDALVTSLKEIPILITTADCVPILLYSKEKSVIGVIHAGWKGTASSVVEKTVEKMLEKYMVRPSQIYAAIGPAIGQGQYEVGEDVAEQLVKATESDEFVNNNFSKPKVDLKLANKIQLEKLGIRNIYVSEMETGKHSTQLYSHRIQGRRAGRQGLIACL